MGIHLALRVGNPKAMVEFFERLLGFRVVETVVSAENRFDLYFMSGDHGERLELIHNYDKSGYEPGSMFAHYGFDIRDIEQIRKNCNAADIGIVEEGVINGRPYLYVKDPQGVYVEMSEFREP